MTSESASVSLAVRPEVPDPAAIRDGSRWGVNVRKLEAGAIVTICTRNSLYRFVVLDPAACHVSVIGGSRFPRPTRVRVVGARAGDTIIKAGWVGLGLRLELADGENRIATSTVEVISIDDKEDA